MQVLEKRVYSGPNHYAHFPVIRLTLQLGVLEQWPSAKIPGFADKLISALPSLEEHGCSYGTHGGFLRRLREDEGTWLGHVLEHIAIEVQNLSGADVTFGKTRGTGVEGEYHVVYEFEERRVGEAAGRLAIRLLTSLLPADLRAQIDDADEEDDDTASFDFAEELEDLIGFAQRRQLGPSTASLVKAAEQRDIPWMRLNDYSLVQFGHGRFQKRIQATVTSETRHIAVEIASDKEETNQILADLGLPVPSQYLVRSASRAQRAARRLGFPVVVKPLDANHGRGVSINLQDEEAVAAAFEKAREHARTIIVENFVDGFDHRMLVVDGELVAVAKRVPGHVVGDGKRTIAALVDEVNSDPRRGIGHEKVLTRIELDHQANRLMDLAGKSAETVLAAGEVFYLRSTGNLSTGGTAVDMTDVVHPDNREMASRAAQAIGLDVAGIDFITTDISRSYREVGGGICEVNAAPGFRMHVAPTEGTPRDVAGPVMDMLFPEGTPNRIPIASVTGTNGKTTVSRMLAHIMKMSGKNVGLATTDGVYIDGEQTVAGDMTGPVSAQMILRDPTVDAAVLETARGGLLRAGLGYRSNDVGAVVNVSGDHLGLGGIDTLDQLAALKRVVVEVSRDCAVLNADDELCLKMADYTKAKRIAYVTLDSSHELVREHIRAGGAACVLEQGINGDMITIYDQGSHIPLLWTHLIPATLDGKARFNVQNAMFGALMAWTLGVKIENIRVGLRTFDTTFFQAPGRLNIFDDHPFRVILDYGHNPVAVSAMAQTAKQLDVLGRRLCVLAAPGDRRDEDVIDIAKAAANIFDHYVLRRDNTLRGREEGEITGILRKTLIAEGVTEDQITVIEDERQALGAALEMAQPGDLLLAFGDDIPRCWNQISTFGNARETSGEASQHPTYRIGGMASGDLEVGDNVPPVTDTGAPTGARPGLIVDQRGVRIARDAED